MNYIKFTFKINLNLKWLQVYTLTSLVGGALKFVKLNIQTTNKNRTFITNSFETMILYSLNFKRNGVT